MEASAASPSAGRPLGSAIYLGVVDAAHDWLVGFLQSRVPTPRGLPLATVERMQVALGEIDALRTTAATLLLAKAQGASQRTKRRRSPASSSRPSRKARLQKAVAVIGDPALTRAHPLERHFRDVLCARGHSPQGDSLLKSCRDCRAQAQCRPEGSAPRPSGFPEVARRRTTLHLSRVAKHVGDCHPV